MEEIEGEVILRLDSIKHFGQGGGADQQQGEPPDGERVAKGRMQPVYHCFQLGADAVEIDGRRNDENVRMTQFPVYLRHVVFLETGMACPPETGIAADAGTDFEVGHRDNINIVVILVTELGGQWTQKIIGILFILAVILLFHVFLRYKVLAGKASGDDQHAKGFKAALLGAYIDGYKKYGQDVNTPAIITDVVGKKLGGLLLCERFLNNAVSLFVTLGLFGTFLGLSMSVSSLTELISYSNTEEWLSVLDSVGGGLIRAAPRQGSYGQHGGQAARQRSEMLGKMHCNPCLS